MKQYVNMGLITFAGTLIGAGLGAALGFAWTQPKGGARERFSFTSNLV